MWIFKLSGGVFAKRYLPWHQNLPHIKSGIWTGVLYFTKFIT
jgi:hypothetical protein